MIGLHTLTGNSEDGSPSSTTREPVITSEAITETIKDVILVGVAFQIIKWTPEQIAVVMVAIGAILGIIKTGWVRNRVTPVAAPVLPENTTVTTTNTSGQATGTTTLPTNQ